MKKLALAVPLVIALAWGCSATVRDNGFVEGEEGGTIGANDGGGGGLIGDGNLAPVDGVPCAPNPANAEIPGNACDDDGDGTVDNPPRATPVSRRTAARPTSRRRSASAPTRRPRATAW